MVWLGFSVFDRICPVGLPSWFMRTCHFHVRLDTFRSKLGTFQIKLEARLSKPHAFDTRCLQNKNKLFRIKLKTSKTLK